MSIDGDASRMADQVRYRVGSPRRCHARWFVFASVMPFMPPAGPAERLSWSKMTPARGFAVSVLASLSLVAAAAAGCGSGGGSGAGPNDSAAGPDSAAGGADGGGQD